MTLFLSELPLWVSIVVLVVIPTCLAMSGPAILHRWIGHQNLAGNNEIAGFKFATVGVIYAVMLAFAVIVVWEKYSDAEIAVVNEAGAAATLYRLTTGAEPYMVAARGAMDRYLRVTIDQDWPQMAVGRESPDATRALDSLYAAAVTLTQQESFHRAIGAEIFTQLDTITQSRRTRLYLASGIVPGIIWVVLYGGAVLTVGFTFFFGTKNVKAQVMMTGILSILVFMGLLVIVSIDYPFTGPTHVDSQPLETVLRDFGSG